MHRTRLTRKRWVRASKSGKGSKLLLGCYCYTGLVVSVSPRASFWAGAREGSGPTTNRERPGCRGQGWTGGPGQRGGGPSLGSRAVSPTLPPRLHAREAAAGRGHSPAPPPPRAPSSVLWKLGPASLSASGTWAGSASRADQSAAASHTRGQWEPPVGTLRRDPSAEPRPPPPRALSGPILLDLNGGGLNHCGASRVGGRETGRELAVRVR